MKYAEYNDLALRLSQVESDAPVTNAQAVLGRLDTVEANDARRLGVTRGHLVEGIEVLFAYLAVKALEVSLCR